MGQNLLAGQLGGTIALLFSLFRVSIITIIIIVVAIMFTMICATVLINEINDWLALKRVSAQSRARRSSPSGRRAMTEVHLVSLHHDECGSRQHSDQHHRGQHHHHQQQHYRPDPVTTAMTMMTSATPNNL